MPLLINLCLCPALALSIIIFRSCAYKKKKKKKKKKGQNCERKKLVVLKNTGLGLWLDQDLKVGLSSPINVGHKHTCKPSKAKRNTHLQEYSE
mmetsp:Transcript_2442/g.4570  ORF Transcript_2442/g.4570 Transcript_2442/m.4570 type:complete len:93 (+) Transcript_2442:41-319(+)